MLIAYAGAERRSGDTAPETPRRKGNYRGRKPGSKAAVFTPEDDAEIIRLYIDGAPYDVIAKEVGQPRTNVFNRCRLLGLPLRVGRWRKGRL
ncbi:hypothetical protein [Shinella granuli]|uniref:Homeodomain-like domain-containing protein n=1 Tax=Shinella granuli TaxID=323621 RepID=A0A4R2C526_SHIGR|nr:hypothetical protein [Shinella granuli]TCN34943.1 hypothetical protein EV665_13122 [Shinella granuli]